jgi:ABC-type sugar transport system substrate-binding protein
MRCGGRSEASAKYLLRQISIIEIISIIWGCLTLARLYKNYTLALVAVLVAVFCLTGCGGGKSQQKPVAQPLKMAVCVADMERDGNKIIKKVMEERKKKEQLDITWLDAKNDPALQSEQIKKLAQQKIKAVVLQVVDPAAGPQLLKSLAEKNIKAVALEALPADAPVDAYVASNHSLAGRLMAEYVINLVRKKNGVPLAQEEPGTAGESRQQGAGGGGGQGGGQQQSSGGQGSGGGGGSQPGGGAAMPPESQLQGNSPASVVLLAGDPDDPASGEIAAAARAVLQESQWARLAGEYQHLHGDPALVPFNMQQALASAGNSIDAVLATDSRLALAAVDVLKAAGLNNRVLTVGVGADEKASQALASGEHDAEVDTRPDLLGQYALDAAVGLARDEHWQYDGQSTSGSYSVPSRIIPVRLVQPENIYLLNQRWSGLQGGGNKQNTSAGEQGGSDSGGGRQEGDGQEGGQQGSQQGSQQGAQGQKTKLKVTTMDGKTVEVEIDGQVKKIESTGGGQGQQSQGGQGQQGGGQ